MTPKVVPLGARPNNWAQLDCGPTILTSCSRAVRKAVIPIRQFLENNLMINQVKNLKII